jgi:hypothetical protein
MSLAPQPSRAERLVGLSSGLAVAAAVLAAGMLLFPRPLADAFFAGWVLVAVGLTVLGAAAAWTDRTPLAWIAALLLAALSIVGMWSIGFLIAPSALLVLLAAGLAQWAVPREPTDTRTDDPPTGFEAALKAMAGVVLAVLGAGLFYEGFFVRELFTRGCASETLDCALAVTRWDAVGLAILGLAALAAGAWLLWTQVTVGRRLASGHPG